MIERTYVMLKPDGVRKQLLDEIIHRIENIGLSVSNVKEMYLDEEIIREHYAHLVDKPFLVTAFTTMLFMESAGEPIFTISVLGLFVPAITKITSFSY